LATRILIAEDGAVTRRLLQGLLEQWGYLVTAVSDGAVALRELERDDAPQLAIIDWMMPGMNGPEVVRRIRAAKVDSYVYIVLLTAKTEKADLLFGLDSGADDFLSKPFDAQELRARLRVGERIIDLQSRLASALSAWEFRAGHDALTGLYNRSMILDLLEREKARCLREQRPLGILLADIDHFKAINDTYGHATGDEVLTAVAGRMQSSLRSYDFLGRYGGEEFLMVAPGCGPVEAPEVAERLRVAVATPICLGRLSLNVTISIGCTIAVAHENTSDSLKRADLTLYEAKNAGRNICRFRPAPPEKDSRSTDFEFSSSPVVRPLTN
jgi:two-component system, cell cycle response regulator